MRLPTGTRIGPYEILSSLGAGGMGEVYRARDPRLSREVAIKILPEEMASDPSRMKRFEKEARSVSALNHPNIVTIYDIGIHEAMHYIAMERVDGKTLREVLVGGVLPMRRVLQIAAQIADGLARAHEAGIVHRDLKPENVMVAKDGLVKILDFGLAKLTSKTEQVSTDTQTSPGTVLGTVGYMSPEQADGQTVDFRSDQFSFGSILYEMATGERAFQKGRGIDTLSAILHEDPTPVGQLNAEAPIPFRWMIQRCLEKEAANRYASTRDLARDLAAIRDHIGDEASREIAPTSRRPSLRSRARRLRPILIPLAALLGGAFLGRALWTARPQALPSFHQLTFREEAIQTARFAPDGQTIVYGSVRDGQPFELSSTRIGSLDSRSLGLAADVLSISPIGEMAILLGGPKKLGTLAKLPLAGGAPREVLESVRSAGWSPDGKTLAVVHVVGRNERLESPIGRVLFESTGSVGSPHFARSGDRILFRDGMSLSIVDPTRKVSSVGESLSPSGYAWSPRGEEVWMTVVVGSTTEVRALRPGGRERLIATFVGTFLLQDVSATGSILADRIAPHARMRCLSSGQTRETDLSWLDASVPADISPNGGLVLFTEQGVGGGEYGSVFVRSTDAASAVRLGEGRALALSPDGKWALARHGQQTILLPTGAGQPRRVTSEGIDFDRGATFFPDGRLLLSGTSPGHSIRLYVLTEGGERPVALTGENVSIPEGTHTVSPDGRAVAASDSENRWSIYPLEEGSVLPARPIRGLLANERPVRWSSDGRSLYVLGESGTLTRLDIATGRREALKEFPPQSAVFPTPDGRIYVYGYGSDLSNLFLIEGLK